MDREHQRFPYKVQVDFRTASSFLVSYSVNLSRGGIFLETLDAPEVGTQINLTLQVPGTGSIDLEGRVSWRRTNADATGPAGIGVEFADVTAGLGDIIDRLVANFEGLDILLLCKDRKDRSALTRLIRSIISTAEVVGAADPHVAHTLLTDDIDLLVVDADADPEGALVTLKRAKDSKTGIPCVALTSNKKQRERARIAGADEVGSNPPPFKEFQQLLVRALGRPLRIRR